MKILVTGGAGFIGSHTCVELLNQGYEPVVIDNYSNSNPVVFDRIKKITGKNVKFYEGDIRDKEILRKIFKENDIFGTIHFAGLKAVGESVEKPLMYYENNVTGTLNLLEVMNENDVRNIIFSSSATVYGEPSEIPLTEKADLGPTNPYGQSKLMVEHIMQDLYKAENNWNIVLLRYFNPVGAHESGLIGEDPNGKPNNLFPFIVQVLIGKREMLSVFGDDYDTPDGTGVRDYIHILDLVDGHISALDLLKKECGLEIINLGTGAGYSVLQIIKEFEKATGKAVPYKVTERRSGDIATSYADPEKALNKMNWKAKYSIDKMCVDMWNWQVKNPAGY